MNFFVKATPAPRVNSKNVVYLGIYLAGFFTVAAVSQLVTFEDFPMLIQSYDLNLTSGYSQLLAALVVTLEVLAIPFLLGMRLSPLMRLLSLISGWLALLWWLAISLSLTFLMSDIINTGLFGSGVIAPSGWWSMCFIAMIIGLHVCVVGSTYSQQVKKVLRGLGLHLAPMERRMKLLYRTEVRVMKEITQKIEVAMADFFKQAPHLPKNGQKWIAQNAWWIVGIGVVVSIIAIVALLPIMFGATLLLPTLTPAYGTPLYGTYFVGQAWLTFLVSVVIIVLEGTAITPLRKQQKRGWNLVFFALLLSAASSVVIGVLTLNLSDLLSAALTLLIGGYFLFEVRRLFVPAGKKHLKPAHTK